MQLLSADWRIHAVDLFQLLHAGLNLGCVTGARLELGDKSATLLCQHSLLAFETTLSLSIHERALLQVKLEVAREYGDVTAVDLDDLVHDAVDEVAISSGRS